MGVSPRSKGRHVSNLRASVLCLQKANVCIAVTMSPQRAVCILMKVVMPIPGNVPDLLTVALMGPFLLWISAFLAVWAGTVLSSLKIASNHDLG